MDSSADTVQQHEIVSFHVKKTYLFWPAVSWNQLHVKLCVRNHTNIKNQESENTVHEYMKKITCGINKFCEKYMMDLQKVCFILFYFCIIIFHLHFPIFAFSLHYLILYIFAYLFIYIFMFSVEPFWKILINEAYVKNFYVKQTNYVINHMW